MLTQQFRMINIQRRDYTATHSVSANSSEQLSGNMGTHVMITLKTAPMDLHAAMCSELQRKVATFFILLQGSSQIEIENDSRFMSPKCRASLKASRINLSNGQKVKREPPSL